jgi:translin
MILNQSDFEGMRTALQDYDTKRELLIKKGRDVLKLSKQLIYAVHRDTADAVKLVGHIKKEKTELEKLAGQDVFLQTEGSYRVALQEYAEAMLYYGFIHQGKLPTRKELGLSPTHYVLGLCDLPGELVRKAVFLAGKGKSKEVVAIRDLVDKLYGVLLTFDFRDNETRRKFDSVKYDLRKLEDLVLDLKLKGRLDE